MKRQLLQLWIVGLLVVFSFKANAQVNLGFENWTETTYYSEPEGYFTLNFQSFFTAGAANVTEVTGQSGSAMRLETIAVGMDTINGFATTASGFNIFSGGVPYTGFPDSVRITARHNMVGNDSATAYFIFKAFGVPMFNQVKIGGNASSWTTYTFPLNLFAQPDTLISVFSSSNLTANAKAGSWIEIDKVEMIGTSEQMPNNDFNNWVDIKTEEPDGWFSTNLISAIFDGSASASVVKSTDASVGTYACEVNTVELNIFGSKDTLGAVTNAPNFLFGGGAGIPFNAQPSKITFDYKYVPQGNDTALAWVRFGTASGDSINGGIEPLVATSSYTNYEMMFDWTGKSNPDSLLIAFSSSNETGGSANLGSKLTIDNIQIEYSAGITTPVPGFDNGVSLYPNPAGDIIHFKLDESFNGTGQIKVYDMVGRVINEFEINASNTKSMDISKYEAGQYLYELRIKDKVYSGKFVKQ